MLRRADPKAPGNELVPHEPLAGPQLAPAFEHHLALCILVLSLQPQQPLFHPVGQRELARGIARGKQEGNRLCQVADSVITLLEKPGRDSGLLASPLPEPDRGHQPFRSPANQKVHRPCGIGGRRAREVLDQCSHLLVRGRGLIQSGIEPGKALHSAGSTSGPADPLASCPASSSSPSKRVLIARASMPRSCSQRTTVPVYPCVTTPPQHRWPRWPPSGWANPRDPRAEIPGPMSAAAERRAPSSSPRQNRWSDGESAEPRSMRPRRAEQ